MIIVDKKLRELERAKTPIRVGLVGAGVAASGFALQMLTSVVGMRLVAISNRTLPTAEKVYKDSGIDSYVYVSTQDEFEKAAREGKYIITQNAFHLTDSKNIDVIVEATGTVEFGAQVVLRAIKNKKHVVLINAELDTTLGSIFKHYADQNGVVYTQADGDQPAVLMNLYRWVKSLGFKPVMAGNIKSLIDPYRTPETQEKWAEENHQKPKIAASFADGTKISLEMATVANATGFRVAKRGMLGPSCSRVDDAYKLFPVEKLMNGGIVDYVLGAEPSFGVFVLGFSDNPIKQRYMKMYKMGDGSLYTFYVPHHLSPLEAPLSVARAFLFGDAALAPIGAPVCDVVTIAKKNLKKGEVLDGVGGFTCYGAIDNYDVIKRENLLPIGLSEGCVLIQDIEVDTPITYEDVELPRARLADKLKEEQNRMFS